MSCSSFEPSVNKLLFGWLQQAQPTQREQCRKGQRPCPHVACEHHLYLQIEADGQFVLQYKRQEVWELENTCKLDLDEQGLPSPPNLPLRCKRIPPQNTPPAPSAQPSTLPENSEAHRT